jgi:hypothetical protein
MYQPQEGQPAPYEENSGSGWWSWAESTASYVAGLFSGKGESGCWVGYANRPLLEPCPGTPNFDAVIRAVQRAPQSEIDLLIQYLKASNSGRGPNSRDELANPACVPNWVKAMMGGKGCVASKFPHYPAWLIGFVQRHGAPMTKEETVPGHTLPETLQGAGSTTGALVAGTLALFFLPKLFGK